MTNYRKKYQQEFKITLIKGENIHHIDLDRTNNDINNLIKLNHKEHRKAHIQLNNLIKGVFKLNQNLFYNQLANFLIINNFVNYNKQLNQYYFINKIYYT